LIKKNVVTIERSWLDESGEIRSNTDLRSISKSWDAATWEIFLQETVEKPTADDEVQNTEYLERMNDETETIWEFHQTLPEFVETKISAVIKCIEKINKKIIFGRYWLKCSYRYLAETLGIAVSTAFDRERAALGEIRTQLEIDPNILSYLLRGSANSTTQERNRDQQIADVYKSHLRGSYMK